MWNIVIYSENTVAAFYISCTNLRYISEISERTCSEQFQIDAQAIRIPWLRCYDVTFYRSIKSTPPRKQRNRANPLSREWLLVACDVRGHNVTASNNASSKRPQIKMLTRVITYMISSSARLRVGNHSTHGYSTEKGHRLSVNPEFYGALSEITELQ